MKSQTGHVDKKGFTIIELLTVMSIIVVLIGLLVPALNQVRRFSLKVKQNAQIHAIEAAMELYRIEFDQYPDSGALDNEDAEYCGAMKLCEALMGQDLMGYHPDSQFTASDTTSNGRQLYRLPPGPAFQKNLQQREGVYLEPEKVDTAMLMDVYKNTGAFSGQVGERMFVINDVYRRTQNLGASGPSKLGLPVLYYRADVTGTTHDPNNPTGGAALPTKVAKNGFIYNYWDNQEIIELGNPFSSTPPQPWSQAGGNPLDFYAATENERIRDAMSFSGSGTVSRPHRRDSYILISAGWDGLYGTRDDVTNFDTN